MKRKLVLFFAAACLLLPEGLRAQGIKAIRINEVLVYNDSGYRDDYGVSSGWFEVYNTGQRTLSLAGCYVTNDPKNPKKYRIPKNAQNASIIPSAYAVFFAYNQSARSPFHVNFNLSDTGFVGGGRAYIALYDQSGKDLIDSVSYVVSAQKSNQSFGKLESDLKGPFQIFEQATPMAQNESSSDMSRSEVYQAKDPHGIVIAITSMSVVFLLLLVIACVFKGTGLYFKKKESKQNAPKQVEKQSIRESISSDANVEDEVSAAIAAALYLYQNDCHEIEDNGFYLNRTFNQPSPWANKGLNFRRTPNKNK